MSRGGSTEAEAHLERVRCLTGVLVAVLVYYISHRQLLNIFTQPMSQQLYNSNTTVHLVIRGVQEKEGKYVLFPYPPRQPPVWSFCLENLPLFFFLNEDH